MKLSENISTKYNVKATARDVRTGEIVATAYGKNLLVNTGRQVIRDVIAGAARRPNEIAIGDDDTSPGSGDTDLGNNVLQKTIDRRVQETYGIEFQVLIETSEANGTTIKEAGLFLDSTLIARALLSPAITKTALIEVTISYTCTINAS